MRDQVPRSARAPARTRRRAGSGCRSIERQQADGTRRRADVLERAKCFRSATSVMRRLITQHRDEFATIPHFYLRREVDATALIRLREDLLPEIESRTGVRLTLSDAAARWHLRYATFPRPMHLGGGPPRSPEQLRRGGWWSRLPEGLTIPVVRSLVKANSRRWRNSARRSWRLHWPDGDAGTNTGQGDGTLQSRQFARG